MKRLNRKLRVRTWLTICLTGFIIVGLLLLLLFQTVFLDDVYESMKVHSLRNAASEVADAYGTESLMDTMDYWSLKEDCNLYVVDNRGQMLASRGVGMEAERMSSGELAAYFDSAKTAPDGTVLSKTKVDFARYNNSESKPPKMPKPDGDRKPPSKHEDNQSKPRESEAAERIVLAMLTDVDNPETSDLVLVSTVTMPMNATARVLRFQLAIAMVVFVLIAVLLAWFMGRSIASPIVRINRAAKGLIDGTYQAPNEGGYSEIAELSRTLSVIDGELRKSEQLQRDLVANVSHDLRTPLTMIIGYSEAIRDLPGEDSAENIQVVIDEAQRLSRLVNDVLDLSRLQSGVEQFSLTPVKLSDLLEEVVARTGRMTQPQGYTVTLDVRQEAVVDADEVRLTQVVYNLLLNAVTHTGEDRRVTVMQEVTDQTVRVSFVDSGDGIPEEELSNIWVRYYQVHSDSCRQHAMNSGLGLSIVHALVSLHGGTCGVDSTPGQGSTFWFELPLSRDVTA